MNVIESVKKLLELGVPPDTIWEEFKRRNPDYYKHLRDRGIPDTRIQQELGLDLRVIERLITPREITPQEVAPPATLLYPTPATPAWIPDEVARTPEEADEQARRAHELYIKGKEKEVEMRKRLIEGIKKDIPEKGTEEEVLEGAAMLQILDRTGWWRALNPWSKEHQLFKKAFNLMSGQERRDLEKIEKEQEEKIKEAEKEIKRATEEGTPPPTTQIGTVEFLKQTPPAAFIPFSFAEAKEKRKVLRAMNNLQADRYADTRIGRRAKIRDTATLLSYLEYLEDLSLTQPTFFAKVIKGVGFMVPWALEMAATKGLYAKVRAIATRLMSKMAALPGGLSAIRGAGWAVGSAARTVAFPHRVYDQLLRRELDRATVHYGEDGQFAIEIGSGSFATDLAKAFGNTFIEVASEAAGGALGEGVRGVARKLAIGRGVIARLRKLPFGKRFVRKLKEEYLKKFPKKTEADFAKKMISRIEYHGLLEEIGEERLATLLHAVTGLEHFGAGEEANVIERVLAGFTQDLKNLHVEATVLSFFPVAGQVASKVVNVHHPVMTKEEIDEIETIAGMSLEELKANIEKERRKLDPAEKRALIRTIVTITGRTEAEVSARLKAIEEGVIPLEEPGLLTPERRESLIRELGGRDADTRLGKVGELKDTELLEIARERDIGVPEIERPEVKITPAQVKLLRGMTTDEIVKQAKEGIVEARQELIRRLNIPNLVDSFFPKAKTPEARRTELIKRSEALVDKIIPEYEIGRDTFKSFAVKRINKELRKEKKLAPPEVEEKVEEEREFIPEVDRLTLEERGILEERLGEGETKERKEELKRLDDLQIQRLAKEKRVKIPIIGDKLSPETIPVITAIKDRGGITSESIKKDYPDFIREGDKGLILQIVRKKGMPLDEMEDVLKEAHILGYDKELIPEILGEWRGRQTEREIQLEEEEGARFIEEKREVGEEWVEERPVAEFNLRTGDKVRIAGEWLDVKEVVPKTEFILENDQKYRIDLFAKLPIEKVRRKKVEEEAEPPVRKYKTAEEFIRDFPDATESFLSKNLEWKKSLKGFERLAGGDKRFAKYGNWFIEDNPMYAEAPLGARIRYHVRDAEGKVVTAEKTIPKAMAKIEKWGGITEKQLADFYAQAIKKEVKEEPAEVIPLSPEAQRVFDMIPIEKWVRRTEIGKKLKIPQSELLPIIKELTEKNRIEVRNVGTPQVEYRRVEATLFKVKPVTPKKKIGKKLTAREKERIKEREKEKYNLFTKERAEQLELDKVPPTPEGIAKAIMGEDKPARIRSHSALLNSPKETQKSIIDKIVVAKKDAIAKSAYAFAKAEIEEFGRIDKGRRLEYVDDIASEVTLKMLQIETWEEYQPMYAVGTYISTLTKRLGMAMFRKVFKKELAEVKDIGELPTPDLSLEKQLVNDETREETKRILEEFYDKLPEHKQRIVDEMLWSIENNIPITDEGIAKATNTKPHTVRWVRDKLKELGEKHNMLFYGGMPLVVSDIKEVFKIISDMVKGIDKELEKAIDVSLLEKEELTPDEVHELFKQIQEYQEKKVKQGELPLERIYMKAPGDRPMTEDWARVIASIARTKNLTDEKLNSIAVKFADDYYGVKIKNLKELSNNQARIFRDYLRTTFNKKGEINLRAKGASEHYIDRIYSSPVVKILSKAGHYFAPRPTLLKMLGAEHLFWMFDHAAIDTQKELRERSKKFQEVFKGIRRGGPVDAAIFFACENMTREGVLKGEAEKLLREAIPEEKAYNKVIEKAKWLRLEYARMIDAINVVRNTLKLDPIPERKYYSPHIVEKGIKEAIKAMPQSEMLLKQWEEVREYVLPAYDTMKHLWPRLANFPYQKSAIQAYRAYLYGYTQINNMAIPLSIIKSEMKLYSPEAQTALKTWLRDIQPKKNMAEYIVGNIIHMATIDGNLSLVMKQALQSLQGMWQVGEKSFFETLSLWNTKIMREMRKTNPLIVGRDPFETKVAEEAISKLDKLRKVIRVMRFGRIPFMVMDYFNIQSSYCCSVRSSLEAYAKETKQDIEKLTNEYIAFTKKAPMIDPFKDIPKPTRNQIKFESIRNIAHKNAAYAQYIYRSHAMPRIFAIPYWRTMFALTSWGMFWAFGYAPRLYKRMVTGIGDEGERLTPNQRLGFARFMMFTILCGVLGAEEWKRYREGRGNRWLALLLIGVGGGAIPFTGMPMVLGLAIATTHWLLAEAGGRLFVPDWRKRQARRDFLRRLRAFLPWGSFWRARRREASRRKKREYRVP